MNEQDLFFKEELMTPNGKNLKIFVTYTMKQHYVTLQNLAHCIGYNGGISDNSYFMKLVKQNNVTLQKLEIPTGANLTAKSIAYCIKLNDDVPIILNAYIHKFHKKILVTKFYKEKLVYSQKLLEFLRTLPYFKDKNIDIPDVTPNVTLENLTENQKEITDSDIKEEFKMTDTGVTTLTVSDIDDIKSRAEALKEAFDVTKKDALRAVIQLKSEEINRDLTPLMNLLQTN